MNEGNELMSNGDNGAFFAAIGEQVIGGPGTLVESGTQSGVAMQDAAALLHTGALS
jgi:hypothetical protein